MASSNLFPNPGSDLIYIDLFLTKKAILKLDLYNYLGQKIKEIEPSNQIVTGQNMIETDISNLSSGTYFVVIKSETQSVTMKFVKI